MREDSSFATNHIGIGIVDKGNWNRILVCVFTGYNEQTPSNTLPLVFQRPTFQRDLSKLNSGYPIAKLMEITQK
jgi:hypothetical protein